MSPISHGVITDGDDVVSDEGPLNEGPVVICKYPFMNDAVAAADRPRAVGSPHFDPIADVRKARTVGRRAEGLIGGRVKHGTLGTRTARTSLVIQAVGSLKMIGSLVLLKRRMDGLI